MPLSRFQLPSRGWIEIGRPATYRPDLAMAGSFLAAEFANAGRPDLANATLVATVGLVQRVARERS